MGNPHLHGYGAHYASPEVRKAIARAEAAEDKLAEVRRLIREVADEALDEWNDGSDARVSKILGALAGHKANYRADIDTILGANEDT